MPRPAPGRGGGKGEAARKAPRAPAERPAKAAAGASFISADRKKAFAPDELSLRITAAVTDEKGRTVVEKLRKLAEANGAWRPEYCRLNVGQQRMNGGNRLRAKAKRGEQVVWPA